MVTAEELRDRIDQLTQEAERLLLKGNFDGARSYREHVQLLRQELEDLAGGILLQASRPSCLLWSAQAHKRHRLQLACWLTWWGWSWVPGLLVLSCMLCASWVGLVSDVPPVPWELSSRRPQVRPVGALTTLACAHCNEWLVRGLQGHLLCHSRCHAPGRALLWVLYPAVGCSEPTNEDFAARVCSNTAEGGVPPAEWALHQEVSGAHQHTAYAVSGGQGMLAMGATP